MGYITLIQRHKTRTTAAVALYVTDRAGVQPVDRRLSSLHDTLTYDEQPYAALVCRLMVSTLHPRNYMDYYSFTDLERMEG